MVRAKKSRSVLIVMEDPNEINTVKVDLSDAFWLTLHGYIIDCRKARLVAHRLKHNRRKQPNPKRLKV